MTDDVFETGDNDLSGAGEAVSITDAMPNHDTVPVKEAEAITAAAAADEDTQTLGGVREETVPIDDEIVYADIRGDAPETEHENGPAYMADEDILPKEFYEDEEERDAGGIEAAPASAEKKKKGGFGRALAKCAALAAVFGLVAGIVFQAVGFGADRLRRTPSYRTEAEDTKDPEASKDEAETPAQQLTEKEDADGTTLEQLVEDSMPSIVAVNVVVRQTTQDFLGRTYSSEAEGAGSGIIIEDDDDNVYILTNHHVIENARTVSVTFNDGNAVNAYIAGYKEAEDIAVIVVDKDDIPDDTMSAIAIAAIGDSDKVKVGGTAVAIGNALGYGQSVTLGIISAVERTVKLTDGTMTLIQTDAAINPGNSGGALLNAYGEVIGVNSLKYSNTAVEGMGFAIPINKAMEIANRIIEGQDESIKDGGEAYLGIYGGTITEEMANMYDCPQGVYVSTPLEGSAAMAAGIESGSIITEFNGKTIKTMDDLTAEIGKCSPGDMVKVTVYIPDYYGSYADPTEMTVKMGSKDDDAYSKAKDYDDMDESEESDETGDKDETGNNKE